MPWHGGNHMVSRQHLAISRGNVFVGRNLPNHLAGFDFNSKLFCPMCNETTPMKQVRLYTVFKIIKEPPWMD